MLTRRTAIMTIVAAGTAAGVAPTGTAGAASPLNLRYLPAGPNGFSRAPVLLTGTREAILIDGGFTLSDGRAVADAIKATDKTLTTIYVSQSDPDYYFNLSAITSVFPQARVVAAPATVAAIEATVQKKLEVWGPRLKDNGPKSLADVVIPVAEASNLALEGEVIEIIEATNIANRRYLYVPSIDAVLGGVMIFSGLHVWMGDTATPELRSGWKKELDAIAARKPKLVIPGHLAPGAATDVSAITFTRDYLLAFDTELAKAGNSAALIQAMKKRYPNLGSDVTLDISAKVAMGEMKWG